MSELNQQNAFLNQIASNLGRPRRSGVTPPNWNQKPYTHLHQGLSQEELIQQFIANLALLRTQVDRVDRSEFPKAFANMLERFAVQSTIYWDDPRLHQLNLCGLLETQSSKHQVWDRAKDKQELRSFAADADLGIVYAELGLSETGTVVLFNGGGRGRVVSLLPPTIAVVLPESKIVPRITEATAYIQQQIPLGLPACINFITGPSRTGDIEMDLVFGVHGPGKVHVFLLRDE